MTEKDCGHHEYERRKFFRRLFATLFSILILFLIVFFLVWIILRPQKPKFTLQDVQIYAFNLSSPNFLTTTIQVTVGSKNPNNLISIYYQKLDVHATYRGQQITLFTTIPPTYQGHEEDVVWSPSVYGTMVPVAPYLGDALVQDQIAGIVLVNIKISGKLKWKVGTWMSGKYHVYVNCPAYISSGERNNVVAVEPGMTKYQFGPPVQECSVDVGLGD